MGLLQHWWCSIGRFPHLAKWGGFVPFYMYLLPHCVSHDLIPTPLQIQDIFRDCLARWQQLFWLHGCGLLLQQKNIQLPYMREITTAIVVVLALAMVSAIPFFSFKNIGVKGRIPFVASIAMVFGIALISFDPPRVLFALCLLLPCEWSFYLAE